MPSLRRKSHRLAEFGWQELRQHDLAKVVQQPGDIAVARLGSSRANV
jgi:hypothetical protein